MSSEIKRRGKGRIYYANASYLGVRLRDCLKTVIRDEAIRRLIELKISVERGDYHRANLSFNDLVTEYNPGSERKESIIRTHLLPVFGGKKVGDIDLVGWATEQAKKHPESTCKKHFHLMRELGFELPKVKFKKVTPVAAMAPNAMVEVPNTIPVRWRSAMTRDVPPFEKR